MKKKARGGIRNVTPSRGVSWKWNIFFFYPAKLPYVAHAAQVRAKQDIKSLIYLCSCEAESSGRGGAAQEGALVQ